jgi:hypothetical protein
MTCSLTYVYVCELCNFGGTVVLLNSCFVPCGLVKYRITNDTLVLYFVSPMVPLCVIENLK